MTHEFKSWPEWFEATLSGAKPFDVRIDDRDGGFRVGDIAWHHEWNPEANDGEGEYTGRTAIYDITYVLAGDEDVLVSRGIEPGYVVLGLRVAGTARG